VFGHYNEDFSVSVQGVALTMDHASSPWTYSREGTCGSVKKIMTSSDDRIIVTPVEPVNLPQRITPYLEIEFPTVVVNPGVRKTIYLTFPIEVGVFLERKGVFTNLDIFSFARQKYSLYGTPTAGLITRWHRSAIFETVPYTEPFKEGILELCLSNESPGVIEVSRGVFESYGMSIWYSSDRAAMKAEISIFSPTIAETSFSSEPCLGCNERGIDLFRALKLPVIQQKSFLMEYGVI